MNDFPTLLTRLRAEAGWSLYRLAKETGLSDKNLGALEKGINSPTLETVQKIAQALGVTLLVSGDSVTSQ